MADEELRAGARRGLPRWLAAVIAAVVLVGVVVAVVVTRGGTDDPPTPTPSGPALDARVDAVTADHSAGRIYRLTADRIVVSDSRARTLATSDPVEASTGAASQVLLLVDEPRSLVWAVPVGGTSAGAVRAYDTETLRLVRKVALPEVVTRAAPIDGRLYVAGRSELLLLDATAPRWESTGLPTAQEMVADPDRDQILALLVSDVLRVGGISVRDSITATAEFPGGSGTLAVTGDTGWVVGTGPRGALVAPIGATVHTIGRPVSGIPGATATLVGVGDRSLFVRVGDTPGTVLCLDGRTGARRQAFPGLRGQVVATRGAAFVADLTGPLRRLPLDGCAG